MDSRSGPDEITQEFDTFGDLKLAPEPEAISNPVDDVHSLYLRGLTASSKEEYWIAWQCYTAALELLQSQETTGREHAFNWRFMSGKIAELEPVLAELASSWPMPNELSRGLSVEPEPNPEPAAQRPRSLRRFAARLGLTAVSNL